MTAPWGVPAVGDHRSMSFMMSCLRKPSTRARTRPSLIEAFTSAISRSCGIVSNEDTTDYPFPRRSDFGGDHSQSPSLPREPPRRDQRAHAAWRAVVVGGAARRQPIPHSVSLDGRVWEL